MDQGLVGMVGSEICWDLEVGDYYYLCMRCEICCCVVILAHCSDMQ